jgi:hypothetical protein
MTQNYHHQEFMWRFHIDLMMTMKGKYEKERSRGEYAY